jgi:hypothetical protein
MASDNTQSSSSTARELQQRISERFGVLPNFFQLSPETPEITEKLWGFAQAAYLDNPLPAVFKERLFVHLSRFCGVRYCIARHTGFLIGLGRPAGDKDARAETVENIIKLLRRPFPRGRGSGVEAAGRQRRSLGHDPGRGSAGDEATLSGR